MASASQGVTVTWNGSALGEVVSVSVDGIASDVIELTPRGQASRVKSFARADVDLGTVSATLRGHVAMSSTNVGLTGTLSISSAGASFSFNKALFQNLNWSASVGEMQTYSVSFKVGA